MFLLLHELLTPGTVLTVVGAAVRHADRSPAVDGPVGAVYA